jgi:hypothetical protein
MCPTVNLSPLSLGICANPPVDGDASDVEKQMKLRQTFHNEGTVKIQLFNPAIWA